MSPGLPDQVRAELSERLREVLTPGQCEQLLWALLELTDASPEFELCYVRELLSALAVPGGD